MKTIYAHCCAPNAYFVRTEDDVAILSYARRVLGCDPKPTEGCPGWVSVTIEGHVQFIDFLFTMGGGVCGAGCVIKHGATAFWDQVANPMKAEREQLRVLARKHPDVVK